MQPPQAADAQHDVEPVAFEKRAPRLVEDRAIGLEVVLDVLPAACLCCSVTTLLQKSDPPQRGFDAVLVEDDLVDFPRGDVLPDAPDLPAESLRREGLYD